MENTRFQRSLELPGVEVFDVIDSRRPWRCFTSAFELMVPSSWRGEIRYRGVRHAVGPGMLFCPGPGDTFEIPRAAAPGSFRVLMIEPECLRGALAEHGSSLESLDFHRVMAAVPAELSASLEQLLDGMRFGATRMKLQSSMVDLGRTLAMHLARGRDGRELAPSTAATERMRELIHADIEKTLDLDTLARETSLSRSQVVRAFKRSYGLPPYAYQLCVRIARAQRLLSMGHTPASVARALRFVDQAHFTRHFGRVVGVTPSAYARALGATQRPSELGPPAPGRRGDHTG